MSKSGNTCSMVFIWQLEIGASLPIHLVGLCPSGGRCWLLDIPPSVIRYGSRSLGLV
jgi:hypothetical protein